MSGIGEVLDREHRLEHRLQTLVWTSALRRIHQQELIIRGLLDFDQVRHLADFLDVPEHLANALAARECLRHVAPLKLACPPLLIQRARTRVGNSAGLLGTRRRRRPSHSNPCGCLKGSWSKSLGGRLTTLTPANVFETPERPLANGRDRPALINRAPRYGGASLLDLDLGPSLFQSRLD